MTHPRHLIAVALCALTTSALAATTLASDPTPATSTDATARPEQATLRKLTSTPITLDARESRLEDVFTFLTTITQAKFEPLWLDQASNTGLERDKPITLKVEGLSALRVLERILDQASPERSDAATWQMTSDGTIQCGPRSRLNQSRRLETYDTRDLLLEVPDYLDAPRIDLQQALQAGQGGGGSQSPFTNTQSTQQANNDEEQRRKRALGEELVTLLKELVEPEQWDTMGGTATMRLYRGTILVNAPDYIHRALAGYPYWPSTATTFSTIQGRRVTTLTRDPQDATKPTSAPPQSQQQPPRDPKP